MGLRLFLSTVRGVPRMIAALRAQTGRSRTDGLLAAAGLAISATAVKFKTTRIAIYSIAGVVYNKAITDLLVLSAAPVVSANTFGVFLVQVNAAGVVSTKMPLVTQAYASAALALAALPAVQAGNVALGYIAVQAAGVDWTGNVSALTGVATFVDAHEVGAA